MAHEMRGEEAARQIAAGGVAREPPREIAADRRDGRAGDMRIGASEHDLTDDHRQPSRHWHGTIPARAAPVLAKKFVLNMSLLGRGQVFLRFNRQNALTHRDVKVLSHCLICNATWINLSVLSTTASPEGKDLIKAGLLTNENSAVLLAGV
jgi:hypothetical protein